MRKILSLLLVVSVIAIYLCACSPRGFSLKINNVNVDEEIYNYYLSAVENDKAYTDSKDKKAAAIELCKKYVAGCELIDKYEIALTAEEKVTVSGRVKAKWLYFKDFYKRYSVSKQTLVEMLEYEQLTDDIVVKLYSEGGEKALTQKEIKAYYDNNYIAAQVISADLIDQSGKPVEKKISDEITEKFTDMRNIVRRGASMESAAQKYPEIAEYDGGTSIISSFDTAYPEGLFEKLSDIQKGKSQAFKYHNIIYLINRLDDSADKTYFPLYTKECIIGMKKTDIEKMINALAESYDIVYNIK